MWYEAIPPFAIIAGCICASGFALKGIDYFMCEGKPRRYNVDSFMEAMMKRDKRITGSEYRQKAL